MRVVDDHVTPPGVGGGAVGVVGGVNIEQVLAPVGGGDISVDRVGKIEIVCVLEYIQVEEIHHRVAVAVASRVACEGVAVGGVNDAVNDR